MLKDWWNEFENVVNDDEKCEMNLEWIEMIRTEFDMIWSEIMWNLTCLYIPWWNPQLVKWTPEGVLICWWRLVCFFFLVTWALAKADFQKLCYEHNIQKQCKDSFILCLGEKTISFIGFAIEVYPFSHNHGSVENGPLWDKPVIFQAPIFHWTMIMGEMLGAIYILRIYAILYLHLHSYMHVFLFQHQGRSFQKFHLNPTVCWVAGPGSSITLVRNIHMVNASTAKLSSMHFHGWEQGDLVTTTTTTTTTTKKKRLYQSQWGIICCWAILIDFSYPICWDYCWSVDYWHWFSKFMMQPLSWIYSFIWGGGNFIGSFSDGGNNTLWRQWWQSGSWDPRCLFSPRAMFAAIFQGSIYSMLGQILWIM